MAFRPIRSSSPSTVTGVQNQAQYTFVRALSDSPTMDLIVWDGQAYREITANQPGRLFGVEMQDYRR